MNRRIVFSGARQCGILAIIVLGAMAALLAACDRSGTAPSTAASSRGSVDIYDMRGTIQSLPTAAAPRQLTIQHENTKDMEAMTMPFTVDPSVSMAGLAVGDKVAFRYEINWSEHSERVTQLSKLSSDTVLDFAKPAASTMPGGN